MLSKDHSAFRPEITKKVAAQRDSTGDIEPNLHPAAATIIDPASASMVDLIPVEPQAKERSFNSASHFFPIIHYWLVHQPNLKMAQILKDHHVRTNLLPLDITEVQLKSVATLLYRTKKKHGSNPAKYAKYRRTRTYGDIEDSLHEWTLLHGAQVLTTERIMRQADAINIELGQDGEKKYPHFRRDNSFVQNFLRRYKVNRTIVEDQLEIIKPKPENFDELEMVDVILPLLDEVLQSCKPMIEAAESTGDTSVARIATGR
jgi:hypothetical protein